MEQTYDSSSTQTMDQLFSTEMVVRLARLKFEAEKSENSSYTEVWKSYPKSLYQNWNYKILSKKNNDKNGYEKGYKYLKNVMLREATKKFRWPLSSRGGERP